MSLLISLNSERESVDCCDLNCGMEGVHSTIELHDCETGYLVFKSHSWLHGKGMSGTGSRERRIFLDYFETVEPAFNYVLSKSKANKADIIAGVLHMWTMWKLR